METESQPVTAAELPDGEYAIVECLGHQTLVGRVTEIERFGTKLLAIEPIWNDALLPVTYRGGASIYAFTPCTKEVAIERRAKQDWDLPVAVRAAMPPALLEGPEPEFSPAFLDPDSDGVHSDDVVPF